MMSSTAKRSLSTISTNNFYAPDCKKFKNSSLKGGECSEEKRFNRQTEFGLFSGLSKTCNQRNKTEEQIRTTPKTLTPKECGLLRGISDSSGQQRKSKQSQITDHFKQTSKSNKSEGKRSPSPSQNVQRNIFAEDIYNTEDSRKDSSTMAEDENKENVAVDSNCPTSCPNRCEDDPLPLKNLGNTCYMNAIIQSVFVLKNFMTELKIGSDQEGNLMTNALLWLYSSYCEQKKLTTSIDDKSIGHHLSNLKTCVGEINSEFKSSMQQDAVEFLDLILGAVKDELINNTDNPIKKYFEIEFECFAKCTKCGSDSQLPSVTNTALYLCIPDNSVQLTLQDAVTNYLKEEITENKCVECESNEKIRFTRIQKLPIILFVQLGRYSDKGSKRHEQVDIPEKLYFQKSDFQSDHSMKEDVCYQLTSAICHYGNTLAGGHYVSYVFEEEKQSWFLCDDDTISESSLEKVQEGTKTCELKSTDGAVCESKKGHSFTVYCIEVYQNGKCHKVNRRYRDFYHLHREIKKMYETPDFPPKKVRNLNQKLIEQRRLALERYLQGVIKNDFIPKEMSEFLSLPQEKLEAHSLRHQSLIAFTTDYRSNRSPCHSGSSSSSSLPDIVVKGTLDGFYSIDDDIYSRH